MSGVQSRNTPVRRAVRGLLKVGKAPLKTVIVTRSGNLSVGNHVAEMRAWLAEQNIEEREVMLHVLNFRIVFRATFDTVDRTDGFTAQFG